MSTVLGERQDGSRLTARQLEVALLLRGGLRYAEIGERLGVTPRQVARLAGQARERASAGTSSHLVAMLAQGRLQGQHADAA
jgi:DNA-binding CsgD family transcriptional regulator